MSGRFVRASKYRHVFGRPTRKEQCYDNIRISKNAWDTNLVKANSHYLSVNWDASGGGAFAVVPLNEKGRLPEAIPLFRGHTAVVLDTDWHPFNDQIIASGSDDCKVPEGFTLNVDSEDVQDVAPVAKLTGHSRKVGHVLFNPSAENVLATSSGDFTVRIWDIEAGSPRLTLKHSDIVQSLSWSANGGLIVTTSRDKKLRVWDVRQEKPAHVGPGHTGAKNSRVVWMGEHDRVATTGFSKMSDRQLGLWDIRSAEQPMNGFELLDSQSGVCMPFWDDGTQCLYLAGKGDGNIRYFEYENDKFEFLSEYKSPDPQRGIAFLPKRAVNVHENEVMRAFKTVNDNYIEPISFVVPRRAEVFQGDIYPPVLGSTPGMTASEWLGGKDGLPPKIDMESVYEGQEPTELPSDYKPPAPLTPAPPAETKKPLPPDVETEGPPRLATVKPPPPSMKEQTAAISSVASKFVDKEEEESEDDDSSSFEEVAQPTIKSIPPAAKAEPEKDAALSKAVDDLSQQATPLSSGVSKATAPTAAATLPPSGQPTSMSVPDADSALIKTSLTEIKSLLEQQKTTMAAQSEMIVRLTSEVETLKRQVARRDI